MAYRESKSTLEGIDEHDDQTKGMVFGNYGMCCLYKGMMDEAEKYLEMGLAHGLKSRDHPWVLTACVGLSEIYFMNKDLKKISRLLEMVDSQLKRTQFPNIELQYEIIRAKCLVLEGHDENISHLADKLATKRSFLLKSLESRSIATVCLYLIDQLPVEFVETSIKTALDANARSGTRHLLGHCHAIYARFFKMQGNIPKASEQMNLAIKISDECGADGWVYLYQQELEELCPLPT